jgi:hypothetical protein
VLNLIFFFFLIKKRNKKNQSAAADKIKELAGRVQYFIASAGSNSLDFLTAYVENFQHFLFQAAGSFRLRTKGLILKIYSEWK